MFMSQRTGLKSFGLAGRRSPGRCLHEARALRGSPWIRWSPKPASSALQSAAPLWFAIETPPNAGADLAFFRRLDVAEHPKQREVVKDLKDAADH
jgi:hypothetical protein